MAALQGSLVKTVTRSVLHLVTVAIAIGRTNTIVDVFIMNKRSQMRLFHYCNYDETTNSLGC